MDKVKITQEQADAIERWPNKTQLLKAAIIGLLEHGKDEPIAKMKTDDLAKALYIGYEVEPEYKVGDTLINTKTGRIFKLYYNGADLENDMINTRSNKNDYRHATESEIAEEKERRWWSSHGRGVWELQEGDLLYEKGASFTVSSINDKFVKFEENSVNFGWGKIKQNFKVACFAENRLDVKS